MRKLWVLLSLTLVSALLLVACNTAPPEAVEEAAPEPTEEVKEEPTEAPEPTEEPEEEPTEEPEEEPTEEPEVEATEEPEVEPTEEPEEEAAEGAEAANNCEKGYEGETIYIHQHAGREGPLAAILGEAFAFATQDAVSEINDSGGVCGATLEVVYRETQYDVEQEVVAYEEAREFDPKPMFILTYGSGATIALKDRVTEDKIVNFAAGLNAEAFYNPADGYTVGVAPIYSDQFAGFLTWVKENWDDIKPEGAGDEIVVGVIGWANAYGASATTPEALAVADALGITVLPMEEQPLSPDADVTGQIQNLLLGEANVIYMQNLSFSATQVIGTLHALGSWDSVILGSVNWAMNQDTINFLGENAQLAEGWYGVFPYLGWNDTDAPGVQNALAAFEAGGYPESEQTNTYLLTYGSMYAIKDILENTINNVGFENLSGENFFETMKEMGTIDAAGLFDLDVRDDNRAPRVTQIRQAQMVDDKIQFVTVEDFFELPDTRPGAEVAMANDGAEEEEEEEEEAASEEAEDEDQAASEEGAAMDSDCNETYEGDTIYVHQHAGREGPLAAILGEAFALATNDAVSEINDAGGICGAELEVVYRETQYDVEQEVVAYEEAREFDPKPMFILTYGSGATIALKDRVTEDKIVNFAAGLNAEAFYNPADGYTVGVAPIYSDQFAGFLTWVKENWDDIKPEDAGDDIVVGVIGWANAYGASATTPEALAVADALGITVLPMEEQPLSPDADVTGQIQNLLLGEANVIYMQNLSFSAAQVIGTLHALGSWDSVILGSVNWAINQDVLNFLGENRQLAEGWYGVSPSYSWPDTDVPGVEKAIAAFEAAGHPESEKSNTYLLTYGSIYALADILKGTVNEVGIDGLSGEAFFETMKEMGTVDALGLFEFDVRDGNRAPAQAQIRQAQMVDGEIQFVTVEDFFQLPDTRPGAEVAMADDGADAGSEDAASEDAADGLCAAGYEGETIYLHQHAGREGPLAAILGEAFAFATSDAISEINDSGGVCGATLEVVYRETQYDVEQEVVAYEEAREFDPKPMFILTYGSGATIALKDRVTEDKIVNFAAGLNAEAFYNPADGYTVGVAPIYSDQFAGFLTWVKENWDDIKPEGAGDEIVVGVIGWANAYGASATTPEALAVADALGITVLPMEEQPLSPDADVTGQIQNLLLGEANVIYMQNLSFSATQVIGTLHALGSWDSVILGSVNWAMNQDTINFLGENSQLAEGWYGVFPYQGWNDTDAPGVQNALAAFEAGGYPENEQSNTYLLTYGSIYAIKDILENTIDRVGFDGLNGEEFFGTMKEMGTIDALGLFELDVRDGNRAPQQAQIRQAQMVDGKIQFVTVEDFFQLPDTRP